MSLVVMWGLPDELIDIILSFHDPFKRIMRRVQAEIWWANAWHYFYKFFSFTYRSKDEPFYKYQLKKNREMALKTFGGNDIYNVSDFDAARG